jgi:hypothetical protein
MVVSEQGPEARRPSFWSADILVRMSAKREESLSLLQKLRRTGMPAFQQNYSLLCGTGSVSSAAAAIGRGS